MQPTQKDGITFYENRPAQCREIGPITTEIGGWVSEAQLKNLSDLKMAMAAQARRMGGNAVVGFEYGQRSVGFWRSLLQLDDVNWYGRGIIAVIDSER